MKGANGFKMSDPRLDKHSSIHHELFDEDTAQVGALGDIVEAHAGDAVFLTPAEKSVGGADGGESDFESEMLSADPDEDAGNDPSDRYSSAVDESAWGTDQTGTVEGIARGFGTHLPQDLGRDGFQVEEIPDQALQYQGRAVADGEELDDYDDEDETNGKFDSEEALAHASEPGVNVVHDVPSEAFPERIPVAQRHPDSTDDALDATRQIK
ncbi:MAG: hypothetical protein JWQ02_3260 [Capsulimonas sp.]|jgi:hypothetical protein|nr:hypothetical protein [Capsulimonas sp.]